MKEIYGINNATFKQLPPGLQYRALDRGDVNTADAFTTDPQLASGKYTVLKDPEGVFSFQNVLFVINKAKYEARGGPAFMSVINKVNSLLTAPAIQSMNKAVLTDKKDPAVVVGQFLKANGLAGGSGSRGTSVEPRARRAPVPAVPGPCLGAGLDGAAAVSARGAS